MRVRPHAVLPAAALVLLALAACSGGPQPQPVDPVVVTRGMLEELTEPHALDRCAARAVLEERSLTADRLGRDGGDRPRNLTASSTLAGQNYQTYLEARSPDNIEERDRRLARMAMHAFDRSLREAEAAAPRAGERRVGALNARAAEAYARVWHRWFELLHREGGQEGRDAARDALLDWLTTRSMTRQDLLEGYYADFMEALEEGCQS